LLEPSGGKSEWDSEELAYRRRFPGGAEGTRTMGKTGLHKGRQGGTVVRDERPFSWGVLVNLNQLVDAILLTVRSQKTY